MTVEAVELAPGYRIGRLVKGHWQLATRHGGSYAREDAIAAMAPFVEAGLNGFDCADHYAGTEEAIGEFRRRRPDLAEQLRVQTKIVPDSDILPRIARSDMDHIVDRARARLGQERLDLMQFHWWDYDHPGWLDALGWLFDMRREGKIAEVGLTNFDVPRLQRMFAAGLVPASHQVQYSMVDRRPDQGVLDLCRRHGVAVQCYGTLLGGFLSEKWLGQPEPEAPANRSQAKYRLIIDEWGSWGLFQDLLATLHEIARGHGVGIGAVALRWVLDRPGVGTCIVGAPDASRLPALLRVFDVRLDDADRTAIDEVVQQGRGPRGDCYDLERVKGGPHASLNWTNQNLKGVGAR